MTETARPARPPQEMVAQRPTPQADDQSGPFWDACARGELIAQQCAACGRFRFPPRPTCPRCRSFDVEWTTLAGTGRIWSWIRAHPPLLPAFATMAPYVSVVVELDEDPVHLRMVGIYAGDAEPAIGERVRVEFEQVGESVLPRWRTTG